MQEFAHGSFQFEAMVQLAKLVVISQSGKRASALARSDCDRILWVVSRMHVDATDGSFKDLATK